MKKFKILDLINSPDDVKVLTMSQLEQLAQDIRTFLIDSVSITGGHLASNLGVVELTIALHKVFDSPRDKLVWDVGHQSYPHKIITGRKNRFNTLRQQDGLSGFPKQKESEHDAFIAGHASTSISAAYGIVKSLSLQGDDHHAVAIIGDGSFTGGMAYEALNNAGRADDNLIVILNHNNMSISKNVGAFARYLSNLRIKPNYIKAKKRIEYALDHLPVIGAPIKKRILSSKSFIRNLIHESNNFFEDLGFAYFGPIDGHNLEDLIQVLQAAKGLKKPVFIQVDTIKGKGYSYAEENPGAFHGVSTFDTDMGLSGDLNEEDFSSIFGKKLTTLAQKDKKICAITAAMKYGTGLQYFKEKHRDRFFDVGIAEEHAVTFAAGLSSANMLPVFAVYSTFLQRSYDQILHDAAIEKQRMVLAIDRAGVVGNDGETHQGLFDVSFLSSIPNVTVYAPSTYSELEIFLERALYLTESIAAVRYPKGKEEKVFDFPVPNADYQLLSPNTKTEILLVTYGRTFSAAYHAKNKLEKDGFPVSLLKLNQILPLPEEVFQICIKYKKIFFFEEGIKNGGVAEHLLVGLFERGFKNTFEITAVDNQFILQANMDIALKHLGLDKESIYKKVMTEMEP